ncbi:hypothetical protein E4H04_02810 [Candidatus Bathyarchaeota archaeon]|nr:hypothetical protein [Candidatus Bathyarchaeota archaeon]TFH18632.1 MAG: hypothetical protein E4H04_02810 [Candidatus Bathyarchaeota archaeon]
MGESPSHLYLKQVGTLWLYNQMCHMVDTEVKLNQLGLLRYLELDNKQVIDVVGVGLKYFQWSRRKIQDELYDDFDLDKPEQYEIGYNTLRGIEVKVSKSDFKNGFICSGTNYNYVLTPTKLISPSLLPKGVGLIEFNRYKFDVSVNDLEENPVSRPFNISGLNVVKRAQYRNLPQFHIDHVIASIAQRRTNNKQETYDEVINGLTDPELVYSLTV